MGPCFANAEMLVVFCSKGIVEGPKGIGKGRTSGWINIHADDVDIIRTGPPPLERAGIIYVRRPEHEYLRITRHSCMHVLPSGDEFGLGYNLWSAYLNVLRKLYNGEPGLDYLLPPTYVGLPSELSRPLET